VAGAPALPVHRTLEMKTCLVEANAPFVEPMIRGHQLAHNRPKSKTCWVLQPVGCFSDKQGLACIYARQTSRHPNSAAKACVLVRDRGDGVRLFFSERSARKCLSGKILQRLDSPLRCGSFEPLAAHSRPITVHGICSAPCWRFVESCNYL
jgi:hypothetical protein